MSITVDARGLSCPQPVLLTLDEINKRDSGEIVVLVDNDTAKENVTRAALSQGWSVKDIQEGKEASYRITFTK